MMIICAALLNASMASVSQCRAAFGRWGVRVPSALQNPAITGTRRKNMGDLQAIALVWTDLSSVVLSAFEGLRHAKPFIHAVVAVSSVVAVQMSILRSRTAIVLGVWLHLVGFLKCCYRIRRAAVMGGVGAAPPIKVLPALCQTRV